MGRFFGFHTKLKWNTKKAKTKEDKVKNEVVCLRYTFNQNAFDYGVVPAAHSNTTSARNGSTVQIKAPSESARAPITPQHVKLPVPKPKLTAPDVPPPVKARSTPNYHREQSEDAEYIEVLDHHSHRNASGGETLLAISEQPPPYEEHARNGFQKVHQKPFAEILQPAAAASRKTEREPEPALNFNEDGNWNLFVKPKEAPEEPKVNAVEEAAYRMRLQDFEDAETESEREEEKEEEKDEEPEEEEEEEEEEERIPTPIQTLSVGGSSLSTQAASIFFGGSDEKPQPTARKVNFFGRKDSASSYGSEASA